MAPATADEVESDRVVVAAANKKRKKGKPAKNQRARKQLSEQAPIPSHIYRAGGVLWVWV